MPFKKGQSGNPRGMIPGTRHRATQIAEKLMASDVREIVRTVIKCAKAGDMTAAKLILERICPPPRASDSFEQRLSQLERALGLESQELGRMPQVIDAGDVNSKDWGEVKGK